MLLRLITPRTEIRNAAGPYSRLLFVKLRSGKSFILSAELWDLLPKGDEIISINNANGLPIFASIEPVKHTKALLKAE